MAGYVWRVIQRGVTGGRDSGYPTTSAVGPLFGTKKGAQAEADRLNERNGNRTIHVMDTGPDGRYTNSSTEKPVYDVDFVPVLTQAQADARQREFVDKERERIERHVENLMAQAKAALDSLPGSD